MAWGRHAPHTVEAGRPGGPERTVADTERLGLDTDVADRPAHAWEVDEAESWEPVVPDTWDPPNEQDDEGTSGDAAAWSEAASREREWASAGDEGPHGGPAPQTVRPPDREARAAEHPVVEHQVAEHHVAEHPVGEPARSPETAEPQPAPARRDAAQAAQPPLTRMALGLASLAAQRMRSGVPAGDGLVTGFGVLRHTANGLMALGERMIRPATQVASVAVKGAATLPVVGAPIRAGLRTRQFLASSAAQVRQTLTRIAAGEPVREPAGAARSGPTEPSNVDSDQPAEQW